MGSLSGRQVVLGVTGGIAAYKAVEVCRRLVAEGAHVTPVVTGGARRMVGETTFSALASAPAVTFTVGFLSIVDPAHRAGPERRRGGGVPRHGPPDLGSAHGALRRRALRDLAGHSSSGRGGPGHAHRDVGAAVGPGQRRGARGARRADRRAGGGAARGWRRGVGPDGRACGHRGRRRGRAHAAGLCRSHGAGHCGEEPASRSTRCASWGTARRASRAPRSPRRPSPEAQMWCS